MNSLRLLLLPAAFLAGMVFSDLATQYGWPWQKHYIELHHDGTAAQTFLCEKRATYLGLNLSSFNYETNRQENCVIHATGSFSSNGDFTGPLFGTTWIGRLYKPLHSITIPAKEIKERRPA